MSEQRPKAGAVLFAADTTKLVEFYSRVCGLRVEGSDDGYVLLGGPAFQLVVQQIPPHIAKDIEISVPPTRRSDAATKLVFFLPDIGLANKAVLDCGGVPAESSTTWIFQGWQVSDTLDPEGNVIQLRAPAAG